MKKHIRINQTKNPKITKSKEAKKPAVHCSLRVFFVNFQPGSKKKQGDGSLAPMSLPFP